jgi:hypothetical protein
MAGVRPPQTVRVPGTGPTHPLDNAIKRQLARVPQQTPPRTAAQSSVKTTTTPSAPVNGGGGSTAPPTPISSATPVAETAGVAGSPGTTGLASDAGHVHSMPAIFPLAFYVGGVLVANRSTVNFVSGAAVVDNPGSDRVDITISGGGGSTSLGIGSPGAYSICAGYQINVGSLGYKQALLLNGLGANAFSPGYDGTALALTKPTANTTSMTARWYLDDAGGSSYVDVVNAPTNNLTAVAGGSPSSLGQGGIDSNAYYLLYSSAAQYAKTTAATCPISGTGDFSLEIVYQDNTAISSGTFMYVAAAGAAIMCHIAYNSGVEFRMFNATQFFVNDTTSRTNGQVVHYICAFNSTTNVMSIYRNGVLKATVTNTDVPRRNTTTGVVEIGRDNTTSVLQKIYLAATYSKEIQATEALARYNALIVAIPPAITSLLDIGSAGYAPISSVTYTVAYKNTLTEVMEYSNDGVNWTAITITGTPPVNGGTLGKYQNTVTLGSPITARYLRYSARDSISAGSVRITDLRAF